MSPPVSPTDYVFNACSEYGESSSTRFLHPFSISSLEDDVDDDDRLGGLLCWEKVPNATGLYVYRSSFYSRLWASTHVHVAFIIFSSATDFTP